MIMVRTGAPAGWTEAAAGMAEKVAIISIIR
jgi:hypothetical protein